MARICVFGERLQPPLDEGIKKLTVNLAAACRTLGHEVLTLTTDAVDWPEMNVVTVRADRLLRSAELARRLAAFRPDAVIYVPTASLTLASGLRSRTLRGYAAAPVALFATQGRRHAAPVRLAARLARPDLCAAQSAATAKQARQLGWPVVQLPPGVDPAVYRPVSPEQKAALRRQFGLPEDAFILLHAGHLNRGRGVMDLVAVVGLAAPVLACSTSTAQDTALAAELRAGGVTVITEYIPSIADLYAAADAYLFPVPPDPHGPSSIDAPLSVLEAAACGLPIIARRFGALPALWPEGAAAGNILYYDDHEGLRRAVACIRENRPAGARWLVEQFSWEAVANQLLQKLTREGSPL